MWSHYKRIDSTDQSPQNPNMHNSRVLIVGQSHHEIKSEKQSCQILTIIYSNG